MSALIGDLSIVASTGVELRASSDIRLAWLWAEEEVNAHLGSWSELSYEERCGHVSDALAELRRSYAVVE